MVTGYLLLDNKSRIPQHNNTRRRGSTPSGVIVIHTAENNTSFTGTDRGAESVANFLLTRDTYGSYHRLCDSNSTVKCAPWSAETFHDTATNPHSVGISGAVKANDWPRLGARGLRIVDRMAAEAADFIRWIKRVHGITVPVRMITRAQAINRTPGFVAHGTMDPGRRYDPGAAFPWDYFLGRVRHHLGNNAAITAPIREPATDVEHLQTMLSDLGHYTGLIDGDYGPMTRAAVIAYQNTNPALAPDGWAGPLTIEHLETEMPYSRAELEQYVHNGVLQAVRNPDVRKEIIKGVWHEATVTRDTGTVPALQELADSVTHSARAVAMVGALTSLVEQLQRIIVAQGQGQTITVDYDRIDAAIDAAVADVVLPDEVTYTRKTDQEVPDDAA